MGQEMQKPQIAREGPEQLMSFSVLTGFQFNFVSYLDEIAITRVKARQATDPDRTSAVLPESRPPSDPSATSVELTDSREGYPPHKAYVFPVAGSHGTVRQELGRLLGENEAFKLAMELGTRCDLNQELAATEVVLFRDSHGKHRNRWDPKLKVETTQEEDLAATSHQLADILATIILSARIFQKSNSREPLSEGEKELLHTLKLGLLRCRSGGVGIRANGRLGVFGEGSLTGPYVRAVGQRIRSIDE